MLRTFGNRIHEHVRVGGKHQQIIYKTILDFWHYYMKKSSYYWLYAFKYHPSITVPGPFSNFPIDLKNKSQVRIVICLDQIKGTYLYSLVASCVLTCDLAVKAYLSQILGSSSTTSEQLVVTS